MSKTKFYHSENIAIMALSGKDAAQEDQRLLESVRWTAIDGTSNGVFSTNDPNLQKVLGAAVGVKSVSEEEYNRLLNNTALAERLEKDQEQLSKAPSTKETKAEAKANLEDKSSQFADRTPLEQSKLDQSNR